MDEDELARHLAALRSAGTPAPWPAIEARLRQEGLIADEPRQRFPQTRALARQLAAAAVCLAVGLGAGITIARGHPGAAPGPTVPALAVTSDSASAMQLAVLQAIVLTTGAALRETPNDALISHYHLAALTQRDALMDQARGRRQASERWF